MSEQLVKPDLNSIESPKEGRKKGQKKKKDDPLKTKSFAFAIRIVNLYKYLTHEQEEDILGRKILSSGTAIGALVRESSSAESKADFIHKLSIALKEARKTEYWILLLHQTGYIEDKACYSLRQDVIEIIKLLVSIIKSTKQNYSHQSRHIQGRLL